MHPLNPFSDPLNYHDLSLKYPALKTHVFKRNGKYVINYKDPKASRDLTCVLFRNNLRLYYGQDLIYVLKYL